MTDTAPTWTVISVFDPDRTGADFAYTVGLHDDTLPELHLPARPTHGTDPGVDFLLSPADRARLLNAWARELQSGTLTLGSTRDIDLDDGHAHARFTATLGQRDLCQTFQANPHAAIITFQWRLERPPHGPIAPVNDRERTALTATVAALTGRLRTRVTDSPVPIADHPTAWDIAAPYGPRHQVVAARARLLTTVPAERTFDLAVLATDDDPIAARHALALLHAAARPAGLTQAVHAATALGQALAEAHARTDAVRTWWCTEYHGTPGVDPLTDDDLIYGLTTLLAYAYACILSADVLGDHTPDRVRPGVHDWLNAALPADLDTADQ